MQKIITAVSLALLAIMPANASKLEIDLDSQADRPVYGLLIQQPINNNLGLFGFGQVTEGWSQAYGGITYAPTTWLEVAAGTGTEQWTSRTRFGGWVWAGKGRFSILHLMEDGGSGAWHKTEFRLKATSNLTLGYVNRAFRGEGPLLEWKATKDVTVKASSFGHGEGELALITSF